MTTMHLREARRLSREELYALVWQRPMIRLAEEFGISGNGLAKICDRLEVPYPPRGYWAKKEAGKPVVNLRLRPRRQDDTPEEVEITPTLPRAAPSPEVARSADIAATKVAGIVVPDGTEDLHPRVKAWVAEHRKKQQEREQEARRHRHETWWTARLLPDLTERDLYRFRVTSAIFRGVETAGGKVEKSPISGRATFLISGHEVECSIVEKLLKSLKKREDAGKWTAYPDHHQAGLESSGFLRVSITTYVDGRQRQWIETRKTKMAEMLPEVVGTIISAGPILERMKRDREDQEKRWREEEARRNEERRLQAIDDKRWLKFREWAEGREELLKLLAFIDEVERRALQDDETVAPGSPIGEWIAWAKRRAEALDPLRHGTAGLFEALSKVTQWS